MNDMDDIYKCPKCSSEEISICANVLIDVNGREILDDINEIVANAIDIDEEAQCDDCGHAFSLDEKPDEDDAD